MIVLATAAYASTAALAPSAQASCVGPMVTIEPDHGPAGSPIMVSGSGFFAECRDVVTCEVGRPCPPPEPSPPVASVTITFTQQDRTTEVGTARPGADYRFEIQIVIPPDATPGAASLGARTSNGIEVRPVEFTVDAGPSTQARGLSGSQPLPVTGFDGRPAVGALLVLYGAALLATRLGRPS